MFSSYASLMSLSLGFCCVLHPICNFGFYGFTHHMLKQFNNLAYIEVKSTQEQSCLCAKNDAWQHIGNGEIKFHESTKELETSG